MRVFALDIGGSSIKRCHVEVSNGRAKILQRLSSVPLPSLEFATLEQLVLESLKEALIEFPSLEAIGISTTGSVDKEGTVISAGHFNGYTNVSWHKLLTPLSPSINRVATVNDGRASAWAEYCGNEESVKSHVHVVVGTGVGGGIVYDGELLMGDSGQAGYIGHIKVAPDSENVCSCGMTGCVEAVASGPAITRSFEQSTGQSLGLDSIAEKALGGDEAAITSISEAGYWLGVGVGNAMNVLNPSVVTIGGGVLLALDRVQSEDGTGVYMDAVARGIKYAAHKRVAASGKLRKARFGNDGGVIGAAQLAAV